jgi:hypothetical protein
MSYLNIGHALIDGPRALFPPDSIDEFGWMEPAIKLGHWETPRLVWTSLAIYFDDTMNREDNFLHPVIRYAHWNQNQDTFTKPRPNWPTVDIQLSYVDEHLEQVNQKVYELHSALTQPPFIPFRVATRNDAPNIETDNSRGILWVEVTNNLQQIKFYTPDLLSGDVLTDRFFILFNFLREIMRPIDRTGWRERYDHDLNIMKHWDWNGQSPDTMS